MVTSSQKSTVKATYQLRKSRSIRQTVCSYYHVKRLKIMYIELDVTNNCHKLKNSRVQNASRKKVYLNKDYLTYERKLTCNHTNISQQISLSPIRHQTELWNSRVQQVSRITSTCQHIKGHVTRVEERPCLPVKDEDVGQNREKLIKKRLANEMKALAPLVNGVVLSPQR